MQRAEAEQTETTERGTTKAFLKQKYLSTYPHAPEQEMTLFRCENELNTR